jgi:hypothetical protein
MLTEQLRLFLRVHGVLTELADRAPLVVILEDLHWPDESSRELLAFLAVRLRGQAVMVVGTVPEEDLGSGARRWATEPERRSGVTWQLLTRLADTEIVADLMPASAGADRLAAVISAAAGNPLYARELAIGGTQALPASIADAVLASPSRISKASRTRGDDSGKLLLRTHQGPVSAAHLRSYLDEFVFRFHRRRAHSRGLVFYRVLLCGLPPGAVHRAWNGHQRHARSGPPTWGTPVKWRPPKRVITRSAASAAWLNTGRTGPPGSGAAIFSLARERPSRTGTGFLP